MKVITPLAVAFLGLISTLGFAAPALQLGISNGSYDVASETIITTARTFNLNAYGLSTKVNPAETHYLAFAIVANPGFIPAQFGSFKVDGKQYKLSSMVFGNPPFEKLQDHDGGDLSPHGLYDTWFTEIAFNFSPSNLTKSLNTEENPGYTPTNNTVTKDKNKYLYKSLFVEASGLNNGYNLHVDLYSTKLNPNTGDRDVNKFAPFSHDAATAYPLVAEKSVGSAPEPGTLAMFATALVGLGFSWARRRWN
jgi:hypothetical protein